MARFFQYQFQTRGDEVPPPSTNFEWFASLSEPVRQKIAPALAVALITATGLIGPPIAPSLTGTGTTPTTASSPVFFSGATIYQSMAFCPISLPNVVAVGVNESTITYKRKLIYQSVAQTQFTSEEITIDKWFSEWRNPVRQKVDPRLSTALVASGPIEPPIAPIFTGTDCKSTTLSSPVFFRGHLIYQSLAYAPFVSTTEVTTASVLPEIRYTRKLIYQSVASPLTVGENITIDKWFEAWVDPPKPKVSIKLGSQQTLSTSANPIVSFSWFANLTEPVRTKLGLAARHQQFIAGPVLSDSQLTDTIESRWHQPWSEPVRLKRGLAVYLQPVATAANIFPLEVIFEDKWHYPWSEPKRFKRGLAAYEQQALAFNPQPVVVSFSYYRPLDEPTRRKRAPQEGISVLAPFTAEVVTPDKWFEQLSEPRRPLFLHPSRQDVVFGPISTTSDAISTFTQSSPVIFGGAVIYQPQAIPVFVPVPPPTYNPDSIEPIIIVERVIIYDPFAEPIFYGPSSVFATLAATEVNKDIAEFDIIIRRRAVSASVSIKEIPRADDAYASLEET